MPVPVETPWVELGEGGVEARLGTPIVVGGKGEVLRVGEVEERDGVGMLVGMGNGGMGKGGMMEGCGG